MVEETRTVGRRLSAARLALVALVALLLPASLAYLLGERSPRHAPLPPGDAWGGPLRPAPLLSRGVRVESKPAGGEAVVDGVYRTSRVWAGGHPRPEDPSWIAIQVGRGHERLLLVWTSSANHDYTDQFYGAPLDYRIETSSDSTNGADGRWRTVATVIGNAHRSRAHAFDFHGQRWVRMVVNRLPEVVNEWGLFIDEIDVHDLSRGGDDVWVFVGDSITSSVFDRAPEHRPGFADLIATLHPGHLPAVVSAGKSRLHHGDAARDIDEILALNPEARVFALGIGSNDSDPLAFRRDMYEVVRRIRRAGRIPIIARIPFRPGIPEDLPARLNQVVDELNGSLGLLPGPDLYAWFRAHPERLSDGLHPDPQGVVDMNRLWAESVAPLYGP